MAKSTINPKQVDFIRYEGNMSLYRLTKTIGQEEYTNDFTSEKLIIYNYEEYILELSTTSTLENEIKNNFEVYWSIAKEQTELKEKKKRQMERFNSMMSDGSIVENITMACLQLSEIIVNL